MNGTDSTEFQKVDLARTLRREKLGLFEAAVGKNSFGAKNELLLQ